MAAYGKGQMLGSGINPESFKLDFGGFADAARMQAQGLSNLGQSIGGAIQSYGDVKKEQKKVDAYNKASAKSIEAAITLGKSYQIKGVEETLNPFLESYNNPNLSPIEKAALLDEGKAMIPNVFGRFDRNQAMLIEQAQNAPAPAAPLTFKRGLLDIGGKPLAVQEGSDGQLYSEDKQFQITNLQAYAEGKPPEIYSAGAIPAANPIDGALNMFPDMNGTPGSMPPVGTPNPLLPALTPQDQAAINGILAAGQLAPQVGEPPASIARPKPAPQYTTRFIPTDKEEKQGRIYTVDEVKKLASQGIKVTGTPLPNGDLYGTSYESLAPQRGEETIIDPATGIVTTRDIALGGDLNKPPTTNLKEGEVLVADPNSPTGTKIVQVPSEVREKAKNDFSNYIAQVGDSYARLNEMGKAVSAGEANPLNYAFSTAVGQTMGRMFGEEGQPLRDQINTMAPNIINVIRQSTQMGSKGMDSNAEREFYIKAMGDPTLPIEANIKALDALDKAYGKGNAVGDILKNYPELAKKVNSYKLTPPKASDAVPTSGSSNIYEKYGVK